MAFTFRKIRAWQKAHGLVLEVYKASRGFPNSEKYGLTNQLRRAAVSVPTNIAEGYKRRSRRDFAHFLNVAESSLEETKYLLLLAADLGYLERSSYERISAMTDEVGRMLCGFQKRLNI